MFDQRIHKIAATLAAVALAMFAAPVASAQAVTSEGMPLIAQVPAEPVAETEDGGGFPWGLLGLLGLFGLAGLKGKENDRNTPRGSAARTEPVTRDATRTDPSARGTTTRPEPATGETTRTDAAKRENPKRP